MSDAQQLWLDLIKERADNERLRARLEQIADIAEGSRTVNSLPHIAKIARDTDEQKVSK